MRSIALLIAGAALGSCTTAPPMPLRTADAQQTLDRLLAGKIAQAPVNCVGSYRSNDMEIIDENTLAFREGAGRVMLVHTSGCGNLRRNGSYALITKQYGSTGLCSGDLAEVRDLAAGMTVGACAINGITPYVMPGR